jgi:hypothetical protein
MVGAYYRLGHSCILTETISSSSTDGLHAGRQVEEFLREFKMSASRTRAKDKTQVGGRSAVAVRRKGACP